MKSIWKFLIVVLSIALLALYIGKGSKATQSRKAMESQRMTWQLQEQQQKREREKEEERERYEEEHANDAEYQVKQGYSKYEEIEVLQFRLTTVQYKKAKEEALDQLHEWIPKYRAEIEEAKKKALTENDASKLEYCDKELGWLEGIVAEISGTESSDTLLF